MAVESDHSQQVWLTGWENDLGFLYKHAKPALDSYLNQELMSW